MIPRPTDKSGQSVAADAAEVGTRPTKAEGERNTTGLPKASGVRSDGFDAMGLEA
jgi:hypothetical protein